MRTCHYLAVTGRPVMVNASRGICASGRIVSDLKVRSGLSGHNVIFTSSQRQCRTGSVTQQNFSQSGFVELESELCIIRTGIYTLSGYSAHAGQQDLHTFVSSIESAGTNTSGAWLNSGKTNIKKELLGLYQSRNKSVDVLVPRDYYPATNPTACHWHIRCPMAEHGRTYQ